MNSSLVNKLRRWYRLHFGWKWYRGSYPDWSAARAASSGYDDAAILQRVVAATREVHAGRALWERDGALFQTRFVNQPLLAALAKCARLSGRLEVVDFGGSLGSTWWQHRSELASLGLTAWRVVEQEHFVRAGHEFAGDVLSFHPNLEDAWKKGRPTVVLFSGVLQCIEEPDVILREVLRLAAPHVVMDRTPFVLRGSTRLAVQYTPPELGGGTYPCWHFRKDDLLRTLTESYDIVEDWAGFDDVDRTIAFRGIHLLHKTGPGSLPVRAVL